MSARLLAQWFPWEAVGAESLREMGTAGMAPVKYLHVWWGRKPLITARAAILGTLLPAWEGETDPVRRTELQRSIERVIGDRPPPECDWPELAPWVLPVVEEYVRVMARGGPTLNRVDFACWARTALIMALDRYWPVNEDALRTGMKVVSMAAEETWDAWAAVAAANPPSPAEPDPPPSHVQESLL